MLLSSETASDGSQQFRIGLLESAGLAWGTVRGPTDTGDWVTITLNSATTQYTAAGSTTSESAGLQKIPNGPSAMMFGLRVSDGAKIYVMQASPLVVVVGDSNGLANGTLQIGVP